MLVLVEASHAIKQSLENRRSHLSISHPSSILNMSYVMMQIHRIFKPEEVHQFGDLIGDRNPIHRQENATQLQLSDASLERNPQIVHGMLSASLFSSIFGTLIPGSLYRAQSVTFKTPIYSNEAVVGRVVVKKIKHVRRRGVMVTCDTHVFKNCGDTAMNAESNEHAIVCISGEATVWIPAP